MVKVVEERNYKKIEQFESEKRFLIEIKRIFNILKGFSFGKI